MAVAVDNYREIFLGGAPLVDTRAPVEFARGSFPTAVNLPLMTDDERAQVGTCYKQKGQDAAVALGHQLVSGELKAERIRAWAEFAKAHPEGYLFCFRGGLRSQTVQRWLEDEAGVAYRRIAGGYKAMRQFLIDAIEAGAKRRLVVVGGMTGTGKTEVIAQLPNSVDLEGFANHRGSGFGARVAPQPGQVDFENRLAIRLLQLDAEDRRTLVLEDESHFVGSCYVPDVLFDRMKQAPIVWLEDSFESRVERILSDYVVGQLADYAAAYGEEEGFARLSAQLLGSLGKISRRLGGERHQRLLHVMEAALAKQRSSGDAGLHREWIAALLTEYYDPMYVYQKQGKANRIVLSGDQAQLLSYLNQTAGQG